MVHPKDLAFPWRRSPEHCAARTAEHPVVIIGAGPVGLAAALDLAAKGHRSIVLDQRGTLSGGSRAICWSKRTLEVMDRVGVAQALLAKGITWSKGKVFCDRRLLYEFDLLPEAGYRMPAFVNLQQYYFEHHCVEAAVLSGRVDLRWHEQLTAIEPRSDGVVLSIATPQGSYRLFAHWLIAADGAHSTVRSSATAPHSSSNGSAYTASSRGGSHVSAMAACCSPATRRTRCPRSARAVATAVCRTPTTSAGSSILCCAASHRRLFSTAMMPSGASPPTRTC